MGVMQVMLSALVETDFESDCDSESCSVHMKGPALPGVSLPAIYSKVSFWSILKISTM